MPRLAVAVLAALLGAAACVAAGTPRDQAMKYLTQKNAVCGSCLYVFDDIDVDLKKKNVAALSQKKALRWFKKNFKLSRICRAGRFTEHMGLTFGGDGFSARLRENAMEFARGAGFGRSDEDRDEFKRIYDGTHDALIRVPDLGANVRVMCDAWFEEVRSVLLE